LNLSTKRLILKDTMFDDLAIIDYPDPRLQKVSAPVEKFDELLAELGARMLVLMRANKGVGLAAPQVGINRRFFVVNATGEPADDLIVVNPELSEMEGSETGEEGCLSLPDLRVQIERSKHARLRAFDAQGNPIDRVADGFEARVWQHEFDHLNGILLIDRMGTVARALHRGLLRDLETKYAELHPPPPPKPAAKPRKRRIR
jgi:peptide deformylase